MSQGHNSRDWEHDGSNESKATRTSLVGPACRVLCDGGADPEEWSPEQDAPTYGAVEGDLSKMHWVDAVRAGFDTQPQAAEAMGKTRSTASRNLEPMVEDPDVPVVGNKGPNGTRIYQYDPDSIQSGDGDGADGDGGSNGGADTEDQPAEDAAAAGDMSGDFPKGIHDYEGSMPDYRHDFDPDGKVPEGVAEYFPSGDEYEELKMYAQTLHQMEAGDMDGQEPFAMQLIGPTGAGKTHAPKRVAEEEDMAYYEITLKDSIDPADLEGYPNVLSDLTTWIDGSVPEALLASQEREVMLVLDEVNRAPNQVRSVFMSVLDSGVEVNLESRAGETVEGCAANLLVVSTRNPADSADYDTYDMDRAQESRLGKTHHVDYLGMNGQEGASREAEVLVGRTACSEEWATKAVEAANQIREKARETPGDGAAGMFGGGGQQNGQQGNQADEVDHAAVLDRGVPTRDLISMARDAVVQGLNDRPEPSMAAVRGFLENDHDGEAFDVASQLFSDKVGGVDPVGDVTGEDAPALAKKLAEARGYGGDG